MVSIGREHDGVSRTWRTRDIMVTAVIAVAFGVVFWAWGLAWDATTPIFAATPWLQDVMYGVWFIPAVLASLIVRKPGAALFAELVAAGVAALLGSRWGADALLSGFLQGMGAEIVFFATAYRLYSFPVLAAAAIGAAIPAWIHDWVLYYAAVDPLIQVLRGIMMVVSTVVITAGGSVLLERSLRRSGVLQGFPG
jgi:energy-coupling factor transport system substrate-specific component